MNIRKPLEWLTDALARRPEGDRNGFLYWATRKALEEGHAERDIANGMYNAASAAGLTHSETEATIKSAFTAHKTKVEATKFAAFMGAHSEEIAWVTARMADGTHLEDAQREWDDDHPAPNWWEEDDEPDQPETDNSGILAIDAYRQTVPTDIEWVCKNIAYKGSVTLLSGPPKGGKSTLIAAQLQWCRENNTQFLGEDVAQGPCLLITEEGGIAVIYKMPDIHSAYIYDRRAANGESFDDTLAKAADWFAKHPDGLIIIDTLAIWANIDDENDAAKTTAAVAKVMLLAQTCNAPIVIVHHSRKSGGSHGEAIRGSGAILATVDISLELKRTPIKESDDRFLDMQGRVLLPIRLWLAFDRLTRRYEVQDPDDQTDGDIEEMLDGISPDGIGVDRAWLTSHWGLADPRPRIKSLVNKGRMRERKVKGPKGFKYLYWAIPPVFKTPRFDDEEDEE